MSQKEYAISHKTHACIGGLKCCGTKYGCSKRTRTGNAKTLTRRYVRRITKRRIKDED